MSEVLGANVSLELLKYAVESANDAIIITTPELDEPHPKIEYVNPAFERMTGWKVDEVIGMTPRVLQGPKTSRELLDRLRRDITTTGEFFGETVNYRKDGTEYVVEWRITPVRDSAGKVAHWVAIQRDVTDRVHAEDAMRRLNETLERRVEDRTEELREANKELEGFIYTVSHDLRAPLRAIMSASMILIEDYGDVLDAEGKGELQRQSAAAKKLGVLMDDLLKLSRLTRQEMTKEPLDVTAIARDVAAEVSGRPSAQKPEIEVQDGLRADGDPRLVRLLLQNLIENAVKFAKKGEVAQVRVGQADGRFFVRDQGIGFNPEYAQKIFLPFERLHGDAEIQGNGVGLANVKRIVERHGGRISAEGKPNEGATFWFTLG